MLHKHVNNRLFYLKHIVLYLSIVTIARATVHINTDPSGAHIRMNTIRAGISPARVIAQPNAYLVSATRDGYFTSFDSLQLFDDTEPTHLALTLEPIPSTLLIRTTPAAAQVSIDGHASGLSPLLLRGIEPGPLTGLIQLDGYAPLHLRHNVEPGTTQILEFDMQRESAEITIESSPDGATVYLNEEAIGTTPLQISALPAGSTELQVQMRGYRTFTETLTVEAGESRHLNISLIAEPGSIHFNSTPERARVLIDDNFRGRTPLSLSTLPAGEYRVTLEHPAYRTIQTNILLQAGEQRDFHFDMEVTGGTLIVTTTPPEARILINDILAGQTQPDPESEDETSLPYEIHPLVEGEHTVTILRTGYRRIQETIDISSHERITKHYDLDPLPKPNYEITTATNVYRGYWSGTNDTDTIELKLETGMIRNIPRDEATSIRSIR